MKKEMVWAALRFSLGFIFLWAFLDKTFGLGFATPAERAWIAGGSPTLGFLTNATTGPFAGIFQAMAGSAIVDWLFMLGLLGIGAGLMLGVLVNISAVAGSVMMLLMWLAVLPPTNNPFMDDHIIYIFALALLAIYKTGRFYGLGNWWRKQRFVKRRPLLFE
jgi:thiosulfate dehydrogenase (quinone) large subunit